MAIGMDASYLKNMSELSQTQNKMDSVKNGINAADAKASEEEMKGAIKQFESYFLEKVLKEMEDSAGFVKEGSAMGMSGLTDYFMGNMNQKLAEHLIEQSGGRFTDTLYAQMCRNYGINNADENAITDASGEA